MKESVMIMFIIAASYLFAFTLSQLYVTQSLAQSMIELSSNKWMIFLIVNMFLLSCWILFTTSCSYCNDFSYFIASYNYIRF